MSPNIRMAVFGVLVVFVAGMWTLAFISKRFEHAALMVAALEPREFDELSLVALGTGGSFENPSRLGPALAVALGEEVVLVDAGRGVAESLRLAEIPVHQVREVLLTSLVPENTVGLDDLWLTGWLGPREAPLVVRGPPGTRALVEGLQAAHAETARTTQEAWALPLAGGRIEVREVRGTEAFEAGGLAVRGAALTGGPAPALAWRFEAAGRSLVIHSVAWGGEPLGELAHDADLLVVAAIFGRSLDMALETGVDRPEVLEAEARRHLRVEEVGALASELGVGGVVLARLRPPPVFHFQYRNVVRESFRGPVVVAEDGQVITP